MRRFFKKNTELSIGFVCSLLVFIFYIIFTNSNDEAISTYRWLDYLFQISIGYIINFIFYCTQIYIPQYKRDQVANKCISVRIDKIVNDMREIFKVLGVKYMGEYDENKVTPEYFKNLLNRIVINDRVSVINSKRLYSFNPDDTARFTVKEWIESKIIDIEYNADNLMKYYTPYINAELMNTIEAIMKSSMHHNFARSLLQIPAGITFVSTNDDIFFGPYFNIMKKLEIISSQYK